MRLFHVELRLAAAGPVAPAEAWDRYVRPARWPEWSPQTRRVSSSAPVLAAGVTGRVRGPLGVSVPFVVDRVDGEAREWSWTVEVGPLPLRLTHRVRGGATGGTETGLTVAGFGPLVVGYLPLAQLALNRLVNEP